MTQNTNTSTRRSLLVFIAATVLVGTSALVLGHQSVETPSAEDAQVVAATAYDYYSMVLATNPLAYFHFDGLTAGSVVGGYSVTFLGNATVGIPSAPLQEKSNKALVIPGAGSDYVTTSLMGGIPGTGSMVAWVYLIQLPSVAHRFFYIAGESAGGNDFDVQFETDNALRFYTGGGENTAYVPNATTLLKKWHMVAVTYVGGASGFRNIYWDGALVGSYTGPVSGGTKANQFSVGYSLVWSGRDFQGNIDDVAVWDHALTTAQISAMWKACHRILTKSLLTSYLNPSTYGQAVTFGAQVTSNVGPPPDGESISFQKGKTVLGTSALTGGSGSFTTATLPGGTNSITAVYGGDVDFAGSASIAVKQVVNKASTTTTLVSSLNPSSYGQSVTFTAKLTPQFIGTVKGSVTFYDGITALATKPLSAGVAKYATSTLAKGVHTITATYNGNANFLGSTASLSQTVN